MRCMCGVVDALVSTFLCAGGSLADKPAMLSDVTRPAHVGGRSRLRDNVPSLLHEFADILGMMGLPNSALVRLSAVLRSHLPNDHMRSA